MELRSDFETLCERYLLGELSESEAEQLEKTYFADDASFERFLAVKEDLLDAYARGDLKGKKLARFEEHYLSNAVRRQRVEDVRDLIRVASTAATKAVHARGELGSAKVHRCPGWQLLTRNLSGHPVLSRVGLVAALLAIVVGAWITVRQIQDWTASRTTEEQAKTENANHSAVPSPTSNLNSGGERATLSPSPSPVNKPEIGPKPPPLTSTQIASLTLVPLSTRETGSSNSLILSEEQRRVRLSLVVSDAGYAGFDVSVRTVEGEQVVRRAGLKATSGETGKTVTITFNAALLSRQDYIVTVIGRRQNGKSTTVGEYYFRVQHTAPQSAATPPSK